MKSNKGRQDISDMREKVAEKIYGDWAIGSRAWEKVMKAEKAPWLKTATKIQALYAGEKEQAESEAFNAGVIKTHKAASKAYGAKIEQAVKAEHDRMIKCCVDEGNDAYKRGVKAGKVLGAKEERDKTMQETIDGINDYTADKISFERCAEIMNINYYELAEMCHKKGDTP